MIDVISLVLSLSSENLIGLVRGAEPVRVSAREKMREDRECVRERIRVRREELSE